MSGTWAINKQIVFYPHKGTTPSIRGSELLTHATACMNLDASGKRDRARSSRLHAVGLHGFTPGKTTGSVRGCGDWGWDGRGASEKLQGRWECSICWLWCWFHDCKQLWKSIKPTLNKEGILFCITYTPIKLTKKTYLKLNNKEINI